MNSNSRASHGDSVELLFAIPHRQQSKKHKAVHIGINPQLVECSIMQNISKNQTVIDPLHKHYFVCTWVLFFLAQMHIYLVCLWIEEDERKSWKGLSALHGSTRQLNLLICPHPHPPLFKSFFSHTRSVFTHINALLPTLPFFFSVWLVKHLV